MPIQKRAREIFFLGFNYTAQEAFDMGYEEYFFNNDYCFIEWPEKIPTLIEDDMVVIKMKLEGKKRIIEVII